jgi:hypothetical protein
MVGYGVTSRGGIGRPLFSFLKYLFNVYFGRGMAILALTNRSAMKGKQRHYFVDRRRKQNIELALGIMSYLPRLGTFDSRILDKLTTNVIILPCSSSACSGCGNSPSCFG